MKKAVNLRVNRFSMRNGIANVPLDLLLVVSTSYSNSKLVVYQLKTVDNGSKFRVGHYIEPISFTFGYIL
ncbi:hypothetical protein FR932_00840 [Moritella marina ATCC 15381]|uniref:Uncharacterized protein n=1 Tax=Moritella marina ATCC 15381 TaxID=1202962 RepID=A0A5J6WF18_MORMI|nr:hypothetical protein FR932_00840 [Moritella marina ATCC 15381]